MNFVWKKMIALQVPSVLNILKKFKYFLATSEGVIRKKRKVNYAFPLIINHVNVFNHGNGRIVLTLKNFNIFFDTGCIFKYKILTYFLTQVVFLNNFFYFYFGCFESNWCRNSKLILWKYPTTIIIAMFFDVFGGRLLQ